MKLNVSLITVCVIGGAALVAALFRVYTAPDRIRERLEVAKASCAQASGQWLRDGGLEGCRPAAGRD